MVILGIDPGYARMGWGVIEQLGGWKCRLIAAGCLETKAGVPMPDRLRQLQQGMQEIVHTYKPDEVAFEELFFGHNTTTALMVGAARGIAIIESANQTPFLYEYTPMQIKQAITGNGRAEKQDIQRMVRLLLHMDEIIKPDDAADAVAAALTHAQAGPGRIQFRMK